jgi:histidyl-tRNA synthetase
VQGSAGAAAVPDVYVVHQAQDSEAALRLAFRAAELLRDTGCAVQTHCGGGSFKAQFKRADASGAQLAVIIGDDEVAANAVTIKSLRETAEQQRVPLDELAESVGDWLYGADEDNSEE